MFFILSSPRGPPPARPDKDPHGPRALTFTTSSPGPYPNHSTPLALTLTTSSPGPYPNHSPPLALTLTTPCPGP